jgi:hypothetical protein
VTELTASKRFPWHDRPLDYAVDPCATRFKVNQSCRQRAYVARDIDTARIRNAIREEVGKALLVAGIILPPPAPKPKRRGPALRLIDK